MKKLLAVAIAMAMLLSAAAFAADLMPEFGVNMEEELSDCMLNVGFTTEDVSDTDIITCVYSEYLYDTVEVSQLQVGDVITWDSEITVESIEESDRGILINGGFEDNENGMTIAPLEGGMYVAMEWDVPSYALLGQAQFLLADEVTFSHYEFTEEGELSDEMVTVTVAAADLKAELAKFADTFDAAATVISVENNLVTEITVNYTP